MLPGLLFAYLAGLFLLTLWVRRRQPVDAPGFYLANRSISAFTTGCSLAATSVGGSATVVSCAMVFQHGLPGSWLDLGGIAGFLCLGGVFANRARDSQALSAAELLGRYGETTRAVSALLILAAELAWLALLAKSTAALLGPALPWLDESSMMALHLAAVLLYTLVGGQLAVSYSDVLQLGLMMLGLIVVAPFFALRAAGGISQLTTRLTPPTPTLGPMGALSLVPLTGLPHICGPDVLAKVFSARDGQSAARGAMMAAAYKLLFAGAMVALGLAAAELLPASTRPTAALATLVQTVLPAPMAALTLLALIATTMSSADQVLLSAITMVDHDLSAYFSFRARWLRPAAAIVLSGCAYVLGLLFPSAIDAMKVAYTIYASALAIPVLLALYPNLRLSRSWVATAMVGGAVVGAGLHFAQLLGIASWSQPILMGLALNIILLLLAAKRAGN